jgi:predicted Zn-dependent peptidase
MTQAVDEAELARAKAQLKGSMFMAREQPLSRAEQAAGHVLMFDRVLEPEELAAEVDAVVAADLVRMTETILSSRRSAVAVLGPRASLKATQAFDRALFG